jgi:hypothetical protein
MPGRAQKSRAVLDERIGFATAGSTQPSAVLGERYDLRYLRDPSAGFRRRYRSNIAGSTLALALFGPTSYGMRTGIISTPARITHVSLSSCACALGCYLLGSAPVPAARCPRVQH